MGRKHDWRCVGCGYVLGVVSYKPFKALNLFTDAVADGDGVVMAFGMAHGRVVCSNCKRIREWRIDEDALKYFAG